MKIGSVVSISLPTKYLEAAYRIIGSDQQYKTRLSKVWQVIVNIVARDPSIDTIALSIGQLKATASNVDLLA